MKLSEMDPDDVRKLLTDNGHDLEIALRKAAGNAEDLIFVVGFGSTSSDKKGFYFYRAITNIMEPFSAHTLAEVTADTLLINKKVRFMQGGEEKPIPTLPEN